MRKELLRAKVALTSKLVADDLPTHVCCIQGRNVGLQEEARDVLSAAAILGSCVGLAVPVLELPLASDLLERHVNLLARPNRRSMRVQKQMQHMTGDHRQVAPLGN